MASDRGVTSTRDSEARHNGLPKGFIVSGIALGIGLGGFLDGIVLHQILQWHHMLSATSGNPTNTVPGLEDNVLWDGLFHALTWVATVAGLYGLWISAPIHREGWGWALFGLTGVGWGLFNVVEGTINHQILGLHHVRESAANHLPWDIGFLVLGALLIVAGVLIVRWAARIPGAEPIRSGRLAGRASP